MKPVLITGATGFLGRHLVHQLKETGQPLRLLCRTACQVEGAEIIPGDITNPQDVASAVQGAAEVYHLAGMVSREPKDNWRLYQTHVEGTRNICEAALRHRPDKLVVVSSSGTIAVSPEPTVHDETSGYKHDVVGEWAYYLSKIYAEKLALGYNLPLVVVNPALLLGPGDDRNSSTRDVALFLRGELLAIPNGGMSFVDARDVAAGLIAAMRQGRPGERYLLGGPNWSFRKLIEEVSRISGIPTPKLQLPQSLSLWSARAVRRLAPVAGKQFEGLDDASVRMSALFWYCDSSKAKLELGFRSRDPLETLKDTVTDIRKRQPSS